MFKLFHDDQDYRHRCRAVLERAWLTGYDDKGRFFYYYGNDNSYRCTDTYTHYEYVYNLVTGCWDLLTQRHTYDPIIQIYEFAKHMNFVNTICDNCDKIDPKYVEADPDTANKAIETNKIAINKFFADNMLAFLCRFIWIYKRTGKEIIENIDGNIDWMYQLDDSHGLDTGSAFVPYRLLKEWMKNFFTRHGKKFNEEAYNEAYNRDGCPFDDMPEEIKMIYTGYGRKYEEKLNDAVNSK